MYFLILQYENQSGEAWDWWMVGTLDDCKSNLRARQASADFSDAKVMQYACFPIGENVCLD